MVTNNNKYFDLFKSSLLGFLVASLGYGFTGIALMIFPYIFMGRSIQYGIVPTMISMGFSSLFIALSQSYAAGLSLFLIFAPMILIFHYCITSEKGFWATFGSMALVLLISIVIVNMALTQGDTLSPQAMVQDIVELQKEINQDMTALEISRLESNLRTTIDFIIKVTPGVTLVGVLLVVYFNYMMTGRWLFANRILITQPPLFANFQVPRVSFLVAGAIFAVGLVAREMGVDPEGLIILNTLILFGFIYMVNGFATVNLYILMLGVPLIIRIIIYVLLMRVPTLNMALMIIGVADSVIGLRRRRGSE